MKTHACTPTEPLWWNGERLDMTENDKILMIVKKTYFTIKDKTLK